MASAISARKETSIRPPIICTQDLLLQHTYPDSLRLRRCSLLLFMLCFKSGRSEVDRQSTQAILATFLGKMLSSIPKFHCYLNNVISSSCVALDLTHRMKSRSSRILECGVKLSSSGWNILRHITPHSSPAESLWTTHCWISSQRMAWSTTGCAVLRTKN